MKIESLLRKQLGLPGLSQSEQLNDCPFSSPAKKHLEFLPCLFPQRSYINVLTTHKEGRKEKVSVLEYVNHSSGVLIPWGGYMNMQMLRQPSPPSSQIPDSQALPISQDKDCKSFF